MASRQAIGESTAAWKARGGGQMTVASRTSTSGVSSATRRQVSSLFAAAKKIYAPGGGFMAGTEAGIARGSKRTVASGVQELASAGLAGTSIVGGLGKKYEEEVGMPARERATTARLGALAGLLQAEAGAELQIAPRYGYQAPTPSYGGGQTPVARRQQMPRQVATQAMPTRQLAQPQQPQQQPQQQPRLTLNFPKKFAPAGQWQATIGGTGFYATGTGGSYQKQVGPLSGPGTPPRKLQTYGPPAPSGYAAPTPKRPLSQYYDVGGELSI